MASVIDVHTHHYPEEARQDPREWARRMGEPHWGQLVTDGPQGWADDSAYLAAMDAGGVGRAVLLGWYWERIETCLWHNSFHADCIRRHPDRWRAFAAVQPTAGWAANERLLEQAYAAGLCGIGEVHPAAQGFSFHDDTWLRICRWAQERQWPITLHVTEPVGHVYPGRLETPLMEIVAMVAGFPELPFIFAHWGGGLPFYMLNRRIAKVLRHCYFDTAASPLLYDARVWRTVVDLVGPERILFGTDFPLRLYPRRESRPSFRSLLEELEGSGLPSAARAAITSGNASRLWGDTVPGS